MDDKLLSGCSGVVRLFLEAPDLSSKSSPLTTCNWGNRIVWLSICLCKNHSRSHLYIHASFQEFYLPVLLISPELSHVRLITDIGHFTIPAFTSSYPSKDNLCLNRCASPLQMYNVLPGNDRAPEWSLLQSGDLHLIPQNNVETVLQNLISFAKQARSIFIGVCIFIKTDAVFIVIYIWRILQIPGSTIDFYWYNTVILSCRIIESSRHIPHSPRRACSVDNRKLVAFLAAAIAFGSFSGFDWLMEMSRSHHILYLSSNGCLSQLGPFGYNSCPD